MKKVFTLGAFLVLAISAFAQQWQTIPSGTTEGLNKIAFFSQTTGFVVGNDGTILRSNDGGATWSQLSGSQDADYYDIVSPTSGVYVIAGAQHWNLPVVAISYDGGANWWLPQIPSTVNAGISSITFVSSTVGYATAGSYVLRTNDGGLTWCATQVASPFLLNHIAFTDAMHGVISGGRHDETGFTMHTNDGGATWTYDNDGYLEPVSTSQSLDASNAWRVGGDVEYGGYISHTTDGGTSWSQLVIPSTAASVTDIHFMDAQHGLAISTNKLLTTNDGGATWQSTQLEQPGTPLYSMTTDNTGSVWIVGYNGVILKSTQNPSSIATQGATLSSLTLGQNYPNPVVNTTQFDFTLPAASAATLKIYSIDGKEVRTLVSSELNSGVHSISWDGTDNAGARLAEGTYIYKLTAGEITVEKRLTLLR